MDITTLFELPWETMPAFNDDMLRADGRKVNADIVETVIEMYSDNTPMPFGKHKDVPLKDVPPAYLLHLWDKDNGIWEEVGTPLHDYIKWVMSALLQDCPDHDLKHKPQK